MNDRTLPELTRSRAASLFTDESGAATAEYAITTMATVVGVGVRSVERIDLLAQHLGPGEQRP